MNTITIAGKVKRIDTHQAGQYVITKLNIVNAKKKKDGTYDNCYIDVKTFGSIGDIKEEDHIVVYGQLRMETWQDKTTGKNRSKHVIMASDDGILKKAANTPNGQPHYQGGQQDYSQQQPPQQNPMNQPFAEDIPF